MSPPSCIGRRDKNMTNVHIIKVWQGKKHSSGFKLADGRTQS